MGRKKKTEAEVRAYWENILADEGLTMDAGRDPGHRKLVLVGGGKDIEDVYEAIVGQNGRVRPKGASPNGAEED